MDFKTPLAIGLTNAHWVKVAIAHIECACVQKLLDKGDFNTAKDALNQLSSNIPEPSFSNFKQRAIKVLSESSAKVLLEIPEQFATYCAYACLMKENNELMFRKYYEYRNNLRDLALAKKDLYQLLDSKPTTVGYQLALFYSNFKEILERITVARRFVEVINSSDALAFFADSYPIEKLDIIAKCLELFNVTTFASSNANWFVSAMKDLGGLAKGVVSYIKTMCVMKQADVDATLIQQASSSADAVISAQINAFEISYDQYVSLFTQMNNALSDMNKVIKAVKINDAAVKEAAKSIDESKYKDIVNDLFLRIFDGERKREVFEEIFCEAPEVENMIFRLAQQLNNEYRDSTKPVCCVGFTEGCIIFLGKIIPLLNFPCHVVTTSLSFYGAATSGDESKDVELEFDNSKYDGKRVIVFDDILDRGITVKKFLAQAKVKTKAVDFNVCMLFAKPNPENVYGDADYLGYMLPNVWVVGYGFDTLFKHRNADAVGSIKESFKKE